MEEITGIKVLDNIIYDYKYQLERHELHKRMLVELNNSLTHFSICNEFSMITFTNEKSSLYVVYNLEEDNELYSSYLLNHFDGYCLRFKRRIKY